MIEIDINSLRGWTARKAGECAEWLEHYPRFSDIEVDENTGIMYFEDEKDAVFFLLRWS